MKADLRPVMLVEDQPDEATLFALACERAGVANPIVTLHHGAEAVAYLSRADQLQPCLIITDIKMPWMDGFELLQWVKQHCPEGDFSTIVLTSSPNAVDAERAYQFGARDFYTKPHTFEDTVQMMKRIKRKWIDQNRSQKKGS